MRAITIPTPGGPEALVLARVPDPVPGPGEVVIEVAAAGINRADVLQRQGRYPPPLGAPDGPGLECSGVIGAVGPDVRGWRVGNRVAALLDGGGYAEQVAVPVTYVLPVPNSVDLIDAAGLPEAVCTAWSNLVMVGRLRSGETVLIHGGSGGVGTIAVQLATALGSRVAVTAGGPERVGRCRDLGAAIGIDYRSEDFVAVLGAETEGRGADLVLDVLGAGYLQRNLEALASDGRLVVIGLQKGRRAELDLGLLLAKRVSMHGTTLRARPPAQKAAIVTAVAEHAWPMLEDGRLRPVIHERLPLGEAAGAHELLESGAVFGKLLLIP